MNSPSKAPGPNPGTIERIALVGNPNVGKSVVFGWLTGQYVTVSNYPGTTVEVTQGNCKIGGRRRVIVDTPGINNLIPMSEDERVTRDILLEDGDIKVIQVGDAKNLRRGVMITLQLAEMEKSVVLVLNMADEAQERGISIDHERLSRVLGIPVLSTVATRRKGFDDLRRHRLAERLLSEVFELEESYMESSACQFEHILSPKVLDSVCTFLGHPPICPHGKPIPRGPCCARFKKEMEPLVRPLADLKPGEEGRVVFITPKSRSRLERLSALGLIPGSVVKLAQKHPSFVLEIGDTTLALDEEIVREIYVKKV